MEAPPSIPELPDTVEASAFVDPRTGLRTVFAVLRDGRTEEARAAVTRILLNDRDAWRRLRTALLAAVPGAEQALIALPRYKEFRDPPHAWQVCAMQDYGPAPGQPVPVFAKEIRAAAAAAAVDASALPWAGVDFDRPLGVPEGWTPPAREEPAEAPEGRPDGPAEPVAAGAALAAANALPPLPAGSGKR
jgi:hypothetical protein